MTAALWRGVVQERHLESSDVAGYLMDDRLAKYQVVAMALAVEVELCLGLHS